MKDAFGREIDYLRISVTQRCNFHCAYCDVGKADPKELTPAQFAALARAFAGVGIKKIRLTGGEPLVRPDIAEIAHAVREAAAPETLAVTTNGFFLEEKAAALKAAGVNAVNISLDTLDADRFRQMTGKDALDAVLRGLTKTLSLGFEKVKINAVLLRGVNDDGAGKLIGLAKEYPLDVRFIELMPTGSAETHGEYLVPSGEILRRFPALRPLPGNDGTAVYYTAEGFQGRIGLISPVSRKFCNTCNRVRLLSSGKVKPCLGRSDVYDLLPYLDDEERLASAVRDVILKKPAGHRFGEAAGNLHSMNQIGG